MFYLCDIPSVQFSLDAEKALCFFSEWVAGENDTAERSQTCCTFWAFQAEDLNIFLQATFLITTLMYKTTIRIFLAHTGTHGL